MGLWNYGGEHGNTGQVIRLVADLGYENCNCNFDLIGGSASLHVNAA